MKKFTILFSAFLPWAACLTFGQWTQTYLSEAKWDMGSASLGSKAWFAGGYIESGSETSQVEVYDVSTGQWNIEYNLSVARGTSVGIACGSKVFFAGGTPPPISTVDIFDTVSGTWTVESLSSPRYFPAAICYGSKVFFAGGFQPDGYNTSDIIDIYDIQTGTWVVETLSQNRAGFAYAVVGDLIIFAGGWITLDETTDLVEIYNCATKTWTTDTLSQARGFLEATAVGNKLVIAGGCSSMNNPSDVVDIYNASDGTWSTATLSVPRCPRAATVNGKAYFVAGGVFDFGWITPSNVIDIYDEASDTWSTDVLIESRSVPSVVGVGNYLVVAGGQNDFGNLTSLVEIFYDPETNINSQLDKDTFFDIFPNPTKDKITFSSSDLISNYQLSIFNLSGEKVFERQLTNTETQIDISALPRGVYFVRVQDEKSVEVGKMVKE
jgi:hypothetical protein